MKTNTFSFQELADFINKQEDSRPVDMMDNLHEETGDCLIHYGQSLGLTARVKSYLNHFGNGEIQFKMRHHKKKVANFIIRAGLLKIYRYRGLKDLLKSFP